MVTFYGELGVNDGFENEIYALNETYGGKKNAAWKENGAREEMGAAVRGISS